MYGSAEELIPFPPECCERMENEKREQVRHTVSQRAEEQRAEERQNARKAQVGTHHASHGGRLFGNFKRVLRKRVSTREKSYRMEA